MVEMIPLTIICGFLGSGKTTLINHLLAAGFGDKKVAVIVNDFGKVSLDDSLIDSSTEDMMVLRNGCVCCTLASDLTNGLNKLLAGGDFDMIVLECSGITAVAPLIRLFNTSFPDQITVKDVIAVADAIRFPKLIKVVLPIKEQVQHATHILLNRCDQVDAKSIPDIIQQIQNINDQAPITQTTYCKISYDQLTGGAALPQSNEIDHTDHTQDWATCTLTLEAIKDLEQLRLLLKKLPDSVQRLKGFITTTAGQTYCVQYVPNDLQITSWSKKVGDDKKNLLIAIGTKEMTTEMSGEFSSCVLSKLVQG
jgi:G3E family GTPase